MHTSVVEHRVGNQMVAKPWLATKPIAFHCDLGKDT